MPANAAHDPAAHKDVTVDDFHVPQPCHLKWVNICMGRTNDERCPVVVL